jgi:hypothetical protein
MSSNKISEQAMLVSLHIGAYSGMMFDKEVSEEVNESFKADRINAGRYNKRLVATKFLTDVSSAHTNARKTHKVYTLPWNDDGARILTNKAYIEYVKRMKECKRKVEIEVDRFVAGLPEYVSEARERLGNMFDEQDYPSSDELRAKFKFDTEVEPVPVASDFRTKLNEEDAKAIIRDIERRSKLRLEKALNDVFQRVAEKVGKLIEKLREYQPASDGSPTKGRIHSNLVVGIYEFAEMMPVLNITDDPRIEQLQQQLLSELTENSPELLRSDAKLRQQVLSKADKILKKVESYMK